jgi:hypothetical protein
MTDPMVKDDAPAKITPVNDEPASTKINVFSDSAPEPEIKVTPDIPNTPDAPTEPEASSWRSDFNETPPAAAEPAPPSFDTAPETPIVTNDPLPAATPASAVATPAETPAPVAPLGHVEGLHVSTPKKSKPWLWVPLIFLGLLVAGYLLIDSGVVNAGFKMPFHVFKQETPAPPPATSTNQTTQTTTSTPAGFTVYKIAGTNITFAAPAKWGDPTATSEQGYTARGENAKSDGIHAHIIDFATNKDVQVVVTSSKYLPAARSVQYYDFLQWCVGTSDSKYYLGVLQFTTVDKVDKPTTVSCNQGPITDVTKINATTISELNSKDSSGAPFGDLYTMNLTDPEFTVLRVKDKAMTNSTDIKALLKTVKVSKAANSSAQ